MSSEPSWTFHDTVICSLYTSLSEDTLIKYVRYELLIVSYAYTEFPTDVR